MTINFTDRVRRGIARLEEYEPGSTDRIDLETLDAYSLTHCPLAQSIGSGSYTQGRERLGFSWASEEIPEHGFALRESESDRADWRELYARLDATWRTELTAHRAADVA